MAISIRCENAACRKPVRVKDASAGKRIKCPGCGQSMLVPAHSGDSPPAGATQKSRLPVKTKPGVDSPGVHRPQRARWPWVAGAALVLLLSSAAAVYFYNQKQPQTPQVPSNTQLADRSSLAAKPNPETKPEPKPAPQAETKPLPAEVRAAWGKAGAETGWMGQGVGSRPPRGMSHKVNRKMMCWGKPGNLRPR